MNCLIIAASSTLSFLAHFHPILMLWNHFLLSLILVEPLWLQFPLCACLRLSAGRSLNRAILKKTQEYWKCKSPQIPWERAVSRFPAFSCCRSCQRTCIFLVDTFAVYKSQFSEQLFEEINVYHQSRGYIWHTWYPTYLFLISVYLHWVSMWSR